MALVDLDVFLIEWAWLYYVNTTSWLWRKKRENVIFDVSWKRCKVRVGEPEYKPEPPSETTQVLYETKYKNRNGGEQTNTFRTEKESTSKVSVKLTKGFSRSVETGISLPLPDEKKSADERSTKGEGQSGARGDNQSPSSGEENKDGGIRASGVFGNNVQIRCEETTVVEKTQRWAVDTTFTSHSGHITEARLEIVEKQWKSSFKVDVRLKGTIVVNIYDRRRPDRLVDTIQGDIMTLINDAKVAGTLRGIQNVVVDKNSRWVTWPFEGQMDICYGITHNVDMSSTPLPGFTPIYPLIPPR